jgi:hypothetical protein
MALQVWLIVGAFASWFRGLDDVRDGRYLGAAEELSALEQHALVMARIAFGTQLWL